MTSGHLIGIEPRTFGSDVVCEVLCPRGPARAVAIAADGILLLWLECFCSLHPVVRTQPALHAGGVVVERIGKVRIAHPKITLDKGFAAGWGPTEGAAPTPHDTDGPGGCA